MSPHVFSCILCNICLVFYASALLSLEASHLFVLADFRVGLAGEGIFQMCRPRSGS